MTQKTPASPTPTPQPASNGVGDARARVKATMEALSSMVVGREEAIEALFLGLVASEHVVLVGPPGTAKTYLIKSTARLLQAQSFTYLLTKFTTYDELFGSIDVSKLASSGEVSRRWSRIVEAEIVFLDEIFKANSAILNSLLSLMQERVVYDPTTGQEMKANLKMLVGASNETPQDEELQALYDRFTLRVFEDYLDNDHQLLKAIEARWVSGTQVNSPASMADIEKLQNYASELLAKKVKQVGEPIYKMYFINFAPLLKAAREEGLAISDRTIIEKAPKLYAAYLTLHGVTLENMVNSPLQLIKYFAGNREELAKVDTVIKRALGEIAELADKLEIARKLARTGRFDQAIEKLDDILTTDITKLKDKAWVRPRAEVIIAQARKLKAKIQQVQKELEKFDEENGG